MKTFKVPVRNGDLLTIVNKTRSEANSKLSSFGTNKIREKKLSTKTFSYVFDLSNARSGGQRKSIQKLKDILFKAVKKQMPYLEYTRGGDFIRSGNASNTVDIMVQSSYLKFPDTTGQDAPHTATLLDHPWVRSLSRYCRYINYKCIRAGISLYLTFQPDYEIHPNDTSLEYPAQPRYKIKGKVVASLTTYRFPAYVNIVQANVASFTSYDDYEKYMLENLESMASSLADYYNPSAWLVDIYGSRRDQSYYPGAEKYMAVDKVFLVLDEIQQVIKTLSRRASYDTTAFNIGSIESP